MSSIREALEQRELAVLEHQRPEVTRVEQLHADLRIELPQVAQLAVLLPDQRLLERRQLDVQVDLRQVEVGRERLDDRAVGVPGDGEDVGFVSPRDTVEVQDPRQLRLALVCEAGWRIRGQLIRHLTSIVAVRTALGVIKREYIGASYPQVVKLCANRG